MQSPPRPKLTISPDGRRIVYLADRDGTTQLYQRPLDEFEATPIPGTEGTRSWPFISPDGDWVGFFTNSHLKKVRLGDGRAEIVCAVKGGRDGSWGPNEIVFSAGTHRGAVGLYRVAATGGKPEPVALPNPEAGDLYMTYPGLLPGGNALLFVLERNDGQFSITIWALSLKTGEQKMLVGGGWNGYYAQTGHLVYENANGGLLAAPFDLETLQLTGDPVQVLKGPRTNFALADDGTLVYLQQLSRGRGRSRLVWVDRQGRERVVTSEKRRYSNPRLSPDGKQVALTMSDKGASNIWIYDLEQDSFAPFTFEGNVNTWPAWTPDGKWITFLSNRGSSNGFQNSLYRKASQGTGAAEHLLALNRQVAGFRGFSIDFPTWSPDGGVLAFSNSGDDIGILPMDGDREPRVLFSSDYAQFSPSFSPDGRWIAYTSGETRRLRVYVRRYEKPAVAWLVSGQEEAVQPAWSPDGNELFFRRLQSGEMMAVSVQTEPSFESGKPRVLFGGPYRKGSYEVSPDGQRFLMIKQEDERKRTAEIHVVLNWFEELNRLVPTDD